MGKTRQIVYQWRLLSPCPFIPNWKKPTWLLLPLPPFFCWEYFMSLSDWLRKLICTVCMLLMFVIMFQTTWFDTYHRELLFCLPYFAIIGQKFSMFCWLVGVGFVRFFTYWSESTWCVKTCGDYLLIETGNQIPLRNDVCSTGSTISWSLKFPKYWCATHFELQQRRDEKTRIHSMSGIFVFEVKPWYQIWKICDAKPIVSSILFFWTVPLLKWSGNSVMYNAKPTHKSNEAKKIQYFVCLTIVVSVPWI